MLGPVPSAQGFGPDVTSHALVTYSRMSLAFAFHQVCVVGSFLTNIVVSAKYKITSVVSATWDTNKTTNGSFQTIIETRGTVPKC
jgi:hypothetical protein